MRVSNPMMSGHVLSWLQRAQERLFATQAQASSGRRIMRPSDDPAGAARVSLMRSDSARNAQYLSDITAANFWLAAAETAVQSATGTLQQLRDLAIQGANMLETDAGRQALANLARQAYDRLLDLGNEQLNGRYLFAGQASATAPFVATGGSPPLAYVGSAQAPEITISQGVTMPAGITGDRLLNMGGAVDPAHEDLFALVQRLAGLLETGTGAEISATIAELDFHYSNLLSLRGEIGARMQTCNLVAERLQGVQDDMTAAISQLEDADLSEVLVRLAQEQNAYQAAAGIAASLNHVSLMDYLW